MLANNTMRGSQRAINTQIDAMKIGRQIAEQALESHRRTLDSSSGDFFFQYFFSIPKFFQKFRFLFRFTHFYVNLKIFDVISRIK